MSSRYKEHKGSSRSTRDDYRKYKEKDEKRSKSRSRSPRRNRSPLSAYKNLSERPSKSRDKGIEYEDKRRYSGDTWEDSDEELPAPPPPPRISKISIGFSKSKAPIKMTLGASSKPIDKPKATVASVFNADDDDDEPEEMPAEAKMRMRNIGRETPTSAGPNSFGKTKQGFCDAKKVFEKNLKQALETADKPQIKFPQTIYKIKGP